MNHVREFRKNMGLSQLELAKSIGVSRQTINMIENNKYNPTLELCLNLAKALNTDLNSLFYIALGPTGTADEHRARFLARAQLQVFAALRARSHICIGSHGVG